MKKNTVRHVSKHHTDSNNQSQFKSDENPGHDSVGADHDNDGAFETSFREDNGDLRYGPIFWGSKRFGHATKIHNSVI